MLGRLDPTLLENGLYRVRLIVEDVNGQTAVEERVYRVSGEAKVGLFTLSFIDLHVPVSGIPIAVIRIYDSRVKTQRDFGVGWSLDIKSGKYQNNRPPGEGWIINDQPFLGSFLPCIGGVTETRSHFTEVRLSDREFYLFVLTLTGLNLGITGACEATASFRFIDGTTPGARLDILDGTSVIYLRGGDDTLLDMAAFLDGTPIVYNPRRVRLTTAAGVQVDLDRLLGVTRIEDSNENTLTITAGGIAHSSGKSIAFTRDRQGRITEIADPNGHTLRYAYDDDGDLVAFIDQVENQTAFVYDSQHNLREIIDALGRRPTRNEYDGEGRLVAVIDSAGNRVTVFHSLNTREEVTTDRLGKVSIVEYDERGNVVRRTDPLGNATILSYDARDNLLSETDPLGSTRRFRYDAADNLIAETDAMGNTTMRTYNHRNQELTRTDPLEARTSRAYDAKGHVVAETDALGNVTRYSYDPRGNLLTMVDPLGAKYVFAYDAAGNEIRSTDPLGRVTTSLHDANGNVLRQDRTRTTAAGSVEIVSTAYEYDGRNRLVKTIYPDGSITQMVYNALGLPGLTVDQLGRVTTLDHDVERRPTVTTYPDGTTAGSAYDAEGRRIAVTDPAGHRTLYQFDASSRLTTTVYPDETSVSVTYDRVGRTVAQSEERGNRITYDYDAAGRRTAITDPLGGVVAFRYDGNGRTVAVTDARGITTGFEYDARGQRTRVMYADGTESRTSYDVVGRVIAKIDQAGNSTRFDYDALGQVIAITDALGQVTSYTYDELGKALTQTDPAGRTTRFEHDLLGHRTKRVLPLGQVETFAYDVAGNRSSKTDFEGNTTTYAYDVFNRLVGKTPDPGLKQPPVTFTYTAMGHRGSMTDSSGTTVYGYDSRDRLTSKATPRGRLDYAYDSSGNLVSIRSSNANGVSLSYTYDALNRLASVTDGRVSAGSDTVTYSYEANGNLSSARYSNGVIAASVYDDMDRRTRMSIANASSILADYTHAFDSVGHRISVAELSRTASYAYDSVYRLTSETISGDLFGNDGVVTYSYDAAGNRLTRTSSLPSVSSELYGYDANDRLTIDTYDGNGNTTRDNGTTYAYDFENRLTSLNSGAVTFLYDGDGNRVARTVDGVTTEYLVDDRNPTGYAQVLEEIVGGSVERAYTYGRELISQRTANSISFYHYDAQGSTRLLTDASASLTDRYDYDAFGGIVHSAGATPNSYLFRGEQFDSSVGCVLPAGSLLPRGYRTISDGRFLAG